MFLYLEVIHSFNEYLLNIYCVRHNSELIGYIVDKVSALMELMF